MEQKKPSLADKLKGLGSIDDQLAQKMKGLQSTPSTPEAATASTDALSALQGLRDKLNSKLDMMETLQTKLERPPLPGAPPPPPPPMPPAPTPDPEPVWDETATEPEPDRPFRDPIPEVLPPRPPARKDTALIRDLVIEELPPRPASTTTRRLLLIEGSEEDQTIIRDLLATEDVEVMTAATGTEGIARATSLDLDLILVDLVLPDMSGFEVCSRIKSHHATNVPRTRVVVLSSNEDLGDITKAFSAGADDYIIKHPRPTFLVKKIKSYLGLR